MKSILSSHPDAFGYHYGFAGDHRQINVRAEPIWVAYVGGIEVARCETKDEAEEAALDWIKANPVESEEDQ